MTQLTFNKRDFLNAISIGGSCTGNGKILPIDRCIKMKVKNGACRMVSYDGRNAINSVCPIESASEDISFCFDKEEIEKCVSLLHGDKFNFEVSLTDGKMDVKQGTILVSYPIYAADDFPTLAQDTDGVEFKMSSSLLKYWLTNGRPFLHNDDMCLNLANIHFFIKDRKIEVFSSSNEHIYLDSDDIDTDIEHQFSINLMAFSSIMKGLSTDEEVTIKSGTYNTLIKGSNSTLLVRKDDFKVRNYHIFLKYKPDTGVIINKRRLKDILLMANNVDSLIQLSFTPDGILFKSENLDLKKSYTDVYNSDYLGNECRMTFNIMKFMQCINAINHDDVILAPTGEKSPIVIKNVDDNVEKALLMPYVYA